MRDLIDEQIAAGRTDAEIETFFTDRYGEWVLLSPSSGGVGWLVWVLPVGLVAVGGVYAGTRVRRGRPDARAPLSDEERDRARSVLAAWRAGELHPDERLEAALRLLADTADDGDGAGRGTDVAARRVLAAVDRRDAPPAEGVEAVGDQPGTTLAQRGVRWAAGGVVFVGALVVLLAVVVTDRAPGETLTGSLPTEAAAEPPDSAAVDRLRARVADQPTDVQARLALGDALAARGDLPGATEAWQAALAATDDADTQVAAASRFLRAGVPGLARRVAQTVAEAHPDDPDAVLLLGVTQAQAGDPGASTTLERFLELAPGDHPGRPTAQRLTGASDEQGTGGEGG